MIPSTGPEKIPKYNWPVIIVEYLDGRVQIEERTGMILLPRREVEIG